MKCSHSVALVTSVRPVAVAGHCATEWAEWLFEFPSLAAKITSGEGRFSGGDGVWHRAPSRGGDGPCFAGGRPSELCKMLGQGLSLWNFAKNKPNVSPRNFAKFLAGGSPLGTLQNFKSVPNKAPRNFALSQATGRPSELCKISSRGSPFGTLPNKEISRGVAPRNFATF